MHEPDDPPAACPVCEGAYDSVSVHSSGLMINLLENELYQRVCVEPLDAGAGEGRIRFFHHTHEQAAETDD
ncbi:hypothetical protein [Halorientalis marina]|jgi:hypothetical protein|uniref:hypothetical protein n=1 Tax=Halorientalis marina TaxID=2931976 RepID=UPI001FF1B4E6|nr:hypothetical protein [Halorientalis marina]